MNDHYEGPSLSGEAVLEAAAELSGVDKDAVLSALAGDTSVNAVDIHLETKAGMSTAAVLAAKQSVSGLAIADPISARPVGILDAKVAVSAGALAIDGPSPVVAFVEDLPSNVYKVRDALGINDFEVVLMTAVQFSNWYRTLYSDEKLDGRAAASSLSEIFDVLLTTDASDLHLSAGKSPLMRVRGEIREMEFKPLGDEWLKAEFAKLVGEFKMGELEKSHNCDAGCSYGDVRFRINLGRCTDGITAAIRRLPAEIPTFDKISLPASVRRMCELERGLVLVTGPTGSGKSTTLAAMLSHIALNQPRHILTLEDPIEFMLPSRSALVHQRELGQSFTSFSDGLRQSLRQDPDVILVGEARDRETISAAVTAAETGALVFATLHTYDAASTLSRIVSSYPEGEQDHIRSALAYVLRGIVSQTLLPAIRGGRVAAYEVLVATPAVSNNLRKVDGFNQLKQTLSTGGEHGMQTLEWHLAELVRAETISRADAEFKARDVDEFNRLLGNG